jgi:hypothetical protein
MVELLTKFKIKVIIFMIISATLFLSSIFVDDQFISFFLIFLGFFVMMSGPGLLQ